MLAPQKPFDFEGYLFDIYSADHKVYLWLLDNNHRLFLAVDEFFPVIYVSGNRELTRKLIYRLLELQALHTTPGFEEKTLFYENKKIQALRIQLSRPSLLWKIKKKLFVFYGKLNIYHSDLDPVSGYLTDKNLYPMAPVRVKTRLENACNRITHIEATCPLTELEYPLPELRIMTMRLEHSHRLGVNKSNKIVLEYESQKITLENTGHESCLHSLNEILEKTNPDCILSSYGDQTIFPRLFEMAQQSGIALNLDRDTADNITRRIHRDGSSFMSYGSVIYRAPSYPLYGRWHIDAQNSFTYKESHLPGVIELSRISRMPPQRLARASTGNALTAIEMDNAISRGYLVPWQKSALENRKTWYQLHTWDKGGLVYQPNTQKGNVRENVAQLDFAQMYPSIMHIHNISPETVNCPCCTNDPEAPRVPELGYHICRKRRGIVSDSLAHILERRKYYKKRKKEIQKTGQTDIYTPRIDSLKWMNVVSFGYLGFRNAKFGKLESHESVTAFGRDKLLTAKELAEDAGFQFIHAITDCIFIEKPGNTPFYPGELENLSGKIFKETGVEMSIEGVYSWILFLPSKEDALLPVANRYAGRFQDGTLKFRGIAARRKDTPSFIKEFQEKLLTLLQATQNRVQVSATYPTAKKTYLAELEKLKSGKIPWKDLLLRRTVSHALEDYSVRNGTSLSLAQLTGNNMPIEPGEKVRYLVLNANHSIPEKRFLSEESASMLHREYIKVDFDFYVKLLHSAIVELYQPFLVEKIPDHQALQNPTLFD